MRRRRARPLARRIFHWFGASIVASIVFVMIAMGVLEQIFPSQWSNDAERARRYVSRSFEAAWADPVARDEVARTLAEDFGVSVKLEDTGNNVLSRFGPACDGHQTFRRPLGDAASPFGFIEVCQPHRKWPGGAIKLLVALSIMGLTLWGGSLAIARRVTRPLANVAAVADSIGGGDLSARATRGRIRTTEVATLSRAIDEMAERIERQLDDQRELLAAVSHELRTPLGHLRVLIELADGRKADPSKLGRTLHEMEAEILEIDRLVGELLASSKLDFGVEDKRTLDAAEVAGRALERASLPLDKLTAPEGVRFEADAGLLARALANLLDNAVRHGGGLERVVVHETTDRVVFDVEDRGPGVAPGDESRIFQPLQRGENGGFGSLGLGLALVARIAQAHGGAASVENRAEGGARFSIRLPR